MRYNTAVSQLMIFVKYGYGGEFLQKRRGIVLTLLSPLRRMCGEVHEMIGGKDGREPVIGEV